jgi:hypothetical protein
VAPAAIAVCSLSVVATLLLLTVLTGASLSGF